jgi:hypothetical protein
VHSSLRDRRTEAVVPIIRLQWLSDDSAQTLYSGMQIQGAVWDILRPVGGGNGSWRVEAAARDACLSEASIDGASSHCAAPRGVVSRGRREEDETGMTRYRKLKREPVKLRESNACSAFAGICAVLLMSCAVAGLAMSAKGAEFATIDLVDHYGQYKWRVQDRDVDPSTLSTWSIRKPNLVEGGGLSFGLNTVSSPELPSDLYTVYMVWYGELDLSDASTITASITMTYSGSMPTLVCRNLAIPYTAWSYTDGDGNVVYYTPHVRLHFLSSTGDSWDCWDYWWCRGESVYLSFSSTSDTMSWTIEGSLSDLGAWTDRDGHTADYDYDDDISMFDKALQNVRMIGLAFGGNGYGANGVAILNSGSEVVFGLESYEIS